MNKTILSVIIITILFSGCVGTLAKNESSAVKTRSIQNAKGTKDHPKVNINKNNLRKRP